MTTTESMSAGPIVIGSGPGPARVGELDAERLRSIIRAGLAESRARTLGLLDVSDEVARAQIHELMSPLVWDLAHIGNYEHLWLVRAVTGRSSPDPDLDDLYNAFEHPRWERPSLPILGPAEARDYVADVRREALDVLAVADLSPDADRLTADGFVWGMVIAHEHQHCETLCATHQLRLEHATPPPGSQPTSRPTSADGIDPTKAELIEIPAGTWTIGTDDDPWAYDNERDGHEIELAGFAIERHPVTNARYAEFIDDGGYHDDRWWTDAGRAWRDEEEATAPMFWRRRAASDGGGPLDRQVLRFGTWRTVDPAEPVQHVTAHEADAFARWAGRRLPTEAEWEVAASARPDGSRARWPWGDRWPTTAEANLGQVFDGPRPIGSHPDGANPWGVEGLMGDVWEWTASTFEAHPGFRAFPYREYSEVFFGEGYRVLRGGSWATHPHAMRATFRNWDHAIRRQIFTGFRLAADA